MLFVLGCTVVQTDSLPARIADSSFIRCVGDARELAAIEPEQRAVIAGVHDDVSRSGVKMRVHAAITSGTLDDALEVSAIRRVLDGGLCGFAAHLVEHGNQLVHRHEQAMALGAVEQRDFCEGGLHQRDAAKRAVEARIGG